MTTAELEDLVPLEVVITAEDITASAESCPVARKLARLLIEGAVIGVYYDRIRINGRPYTTPDAVRDFIRAFDRRERVGPLTFTLCVERAALKKSAV